LVWQWRRETPRQVVRVWQQENRQLVRVWQWETQQLVQVWQRRSTSPDLIIR
jgi:hypothetical protein